MSFMMNVSTQSQGLQILLLLTLSPLTGMALLTLLVLTMYYLLVTLRSLSSVSLIPHGLNLHPNLRSRGRYCLLKMTMILLFPLSVPCAPPSAPTPLPPIPLQVPDTTQPATQPISPESPQVTSSPLPSSPPTAGSTSPPPPQTSAPVLRCSNRICRPNPKYFGTDQANLATFDPYSPKLFYTPITADALYRTKYSGFDHDHAYLQSLDWLYGLRQGPKNFFSISNQI